MRYNEEESKTSPSKDVVIIAEYRLLNALIYNKDYLDDSRVRESLFSSQPAKSLYKAICRLHDGGYSITNASLLQEASEIDFNISKLMVDSVMEFDKGTDDLTKVVDALVEERRRAHLLSSLKALEESLQKGGELDYNGINSSLYEMEDYSKRFAHDSELMDINSWTDRYEDELDQREDGVFYSYGDPYLDEVITKGAYPGAITIGAGSTSMGKSAWALNLVNNHITNNVPCMYLSLEMSAIDTYDRLVSLRCNIPVKELYDPDNIESVKERVEKEREALKHNNKFRFCDSPDIDIPKLKGLIREFKNTTDSDYCFVVIDLLTQLREFMDVKNGGSVPVSIEIGMNRLNALAKEENVHILGVVQFNRQSDSGKPETVEAIEKLRPTLSSVKNSGAIAERARVLLAVFRRKYYIDRYMQDSPEAQKEEDVMDITVLKNSSGETGVRLEYLYNSKLFRLAHIDRNTPLLASKEETEDNNDNIKIGEYC